MNTITGTYRKGGIDLDGPVTWPEGARVEVSVPEEKIGLTEAEWSTTKEGLAALIKRASEFEPIEMTPEEEAEWMAAQRLSSSSPLRPYGRRWACSDETLSARHRQRR